MSRPQVQELPKLCPGFVHPAASPRPGPPYSESLEHWCCLTQCGSGELFVPQQPVAYNPLFDCRISGVEEPSHHAWADPSGWPTFSSARLGEWRWSRRESCRTGEAKDGEPEACSASSGAC